MTQSMTGYGKAELNINKENLIIEIKSLNSKNIDIKIKMPATYRDKEVELRKVISEKLKRGKVEISIWRQESQASTHQNINISAVKSYYQQILKLKKDLNLKSRGFWSSTFYELGLDRSDIIPTLLRMPGAMIGGEKKVDKNEWEEISKAVNSAINNLLKFRLCEGEKLEDDINVRINRLSTLLKDIIPFEKLRIEKVKNSLRNKLTQIENQNIDEARFEQELIYYLEKQDITEEQVRLKSHLSYFTETIGSVTPNGKKLGFISQEIGREINTIGAKSSDSDMQKIVVEMKDELEKIKEQLLNVL